MTQPETPKKRSLGKSMLAGMSWQYISLFSQGLLNLLVLGTLSRLLSPDDFGLMGIAAIFVGLAELFSELGVGPAIIQRQDLNEKHMRVGFTLALVLGIVMVLILALSAPLIALFFKNEQVTGVVRGVSLSFLFGSFGVVPQALLRRRLKFKEMMLINVGAYAIGYAAIGITMAYMGYGVWALVGATVSQTIIKSVASLLVERIPLKPSFSRPELRELVFFGGGVTLARLFNYGASNGDYFVVGRFLGAAPLGIYTRAFRLMNMPRNYIGRVLDGVLFPVMSKLQDNLTKFTKTYLTAIAMVGLICAPVGILMVILAPEIVSFVLGAQWTEVIIPFQILAIGILPSVSYKIDNSLARSLGAVYERSFRDAIFAVAVVAGAWIGLNWDLWGVAVGVLFAVVLNSVLAVNMSLRLIKCSLKEYGKAQLPGIFLGVVTALAAFPTRYLLHATGMPDWSILIITGVVSGLVLLGLFIWRPQKILGIYGTGALMMILRVIPNRFFPKGVIQWFDTRLQEGTV